MNNENNSQLMHEMGKIAGKLDTLADAVNDNIGNLRHDIQQVRSEMIRIHSEQSARMQQLRDDLTKMIEQSEERMAARLDDTSRRVDRLEEEDKRVISKLAGLTAAGGGIGSALTLVATEILKRVL